MKIHVTVTGSVTAETLGETFITLKRNNEKFKIIRPISKVHNLIVGDTYIYFEGKTECININSGERCVINLK
jgi:hypothetical protein